MEKEELKCNTCSCPRSAVYQPYLDYTPPIDLKKLEDFVKKEKNDLI